MRAGRTCKLEVFSRHKMTIGVHIYLLIHRSTTLSLEVWRREVSNSLSVVYAIHNTAHRPWVHIYLL